ncbi:MAG: SpoIIE family protein phosphatase [Vicinamibacterales bacterium]|jgi:sigma-B regulation protein RsbU (phosphoserine phosphatase)|nr:hypothetical protein [Acidobacteriota bacterium]MDP7472057.1 SpoIIE family protein phosphatase [Vicinamibacterales bacterium]MDP7671185.1 SpoIIE family protein phosphatase [Vicinamibacterales bacterium]HJO38459.1 SpoIIE family protein phosphatase [Vicinamibacterales bacterium]|tara:strand:- start:140 stop:382 length:243 start_codon:yes stop_codon:yes gene_type:complete
MKVGSGDRIVMYTDGILEATNREGVFFDPERLRAFLAERHELSAERLNAALLEPLSDWSSRHPASGGYEDDLTLVAASVE